MNKRFNERIDENDLISGRAGVRLSRGRKTAITLLILLFAFGMVSAESDFVGKSHSTAIQYLEVYSAFLLMAFYIVPFVLFIRWVCRKYSVQGMELMAAFFCGFFIPTGFAGELNDGFGHLMKNLLGKMYSEGWIGSIGVGIFEELVKLITTALVIYVFGRKAMKHWVSYGLCVGMGFQVEEDISYITSEGFKNVNNAFPTVLDRISGAFGSHWAYAAVTAAGLYLMLTAGAIKKNRGRLVDHVEKTNNYKVVIAGNNAGSAAADRKADRRGGTESSLSSASGVNGTKEVAVKRSGSGNKLRNSIDGSSANAAATLDRILKKRRMRGLGLILLVMADHYLYDSPIGDVRLFSALLSLAVVLPVVYLFMNPEMALDDGDLSGAAVRD